MNHWSAISAFVLSLLLNVILLLDHSIQKGPFVPAHEQARRKLLDESYSITVQDRFGGWTKIYGDGFEKFKQKIKVRSVSPGKIDSADTAKCPLTVYLGCNAKTADGQVYDGTITGWYRSWDGSWFISGIGYVWFEDSTQEELEKLVNYKPSDNPFIVTTQPAKK